jgi:hypothetical protein
MQMLALKPANEFLRLDGFLVKTVSSSHATPPAIQIPA